MIVLSWERIEKKKTKTSWQKETESSKIPNSAKGEQQFWFSLKALLKQFYEPRIIKGF